MLVAGPLTHRRFRYQLSLPHTEPPELSCPGLPFQDWKLNASSSSPDNSIVPGFLSPSVPENFRAYQDLSQHMAASLGIQAEILQENTFKLLVILQPSAPQKLFGACQLWCFLLQSVWRNATLHQSRDLRAFIPPIPAPISLVITMVNNGAQQGKFKSTLKDKDSKRMDLMGRKIYTSSALQMWIANQQTCCPPMTL